MTPRPRLNKAGNRRGMSEGSRKSQFKAKPKTATKPTAKPSGPLNKAGNRRGMSTGSRKTQFARKDVIKHTPTAKRTPQQRAQARKLKVEVQKPSTGSKIQDMIDDVMSMEGKTIKKSLIGMAQKMNASADEIARIYAADEALLERAYKDSGLLFESYWEYPIIESEAKGDTLEEILRMVGA